MLYVGVQFEINLSLAFFQCMNVVCTDFFNTIHSYYLNLKPYLGLADVIVCL